MHFIENLSAAEHDAFILCHPLCNLLQSSKWGEVKNNWQTFFVGVKESEELIASAMILKKRLPFKFSIFYIPRGPIMNYDESDLVCFMMNCLKNYAKKQRCIFISFDPAILRFAGKIDEFDEQKGDDNEKLLHTLAACGVKFKGFSQAMDATIQPRYHAYVHNNSSFYEQQSKTLKKALSNINKKKIIVRQHHLDGVDAFEEVMHCTEIRKNIQLRNAAYFKKLLEIFKEDACIYLAHLSLKDLYEELLIRSEQNKKALQECPPHANKKKFTLEELQVSLDRELKELEMYRKEDGDSCVISGALCISFGEHAELLYAGMNDRYKRYMAPYASFFACIDWSFKKGCTYCNMGGIEGDLKGGLTNFKVNFHPIIYEFVGEFDLVVMKTCYFLAKFFMKMRKHMLK